MEPEETEASGHRRSPARVRGRTPVRRAIAPPSPRPWLPLLICLLWGILPLPARALEILAAGDVTPAGRMYVWPPDRLFSDAARERIGQASLFVWNCETSGLSSISKEENTFLFHADGRFFEQMRFANGAAGTANNHVFDGYEEGAGNLLRIFAEQGLRHNGIHERGAYVPLHVDSPWGPRLYFLAGSPMSQIGSGPTLATLNYPALLRIIREVRLRDPAAIIVVYAHDGIEGQIEASPRQTQWARLFAHAGADVVLFAHSHLYGAFSILESSPRRTFVAWGLGNFLFGGNARWKDRVDVRLLSIYIDPVTGDKQGRWVFGQTRNWEFSLWEEQ